MAEVLVVDGDTMVLWLLTRVPLLGAGDAIAVASRSGMRLEKYMVGFS